MEKKKNSKIILTGNCDENLMKGGKIKVVKFMSNNE